MIPLWVSPLTPDTPSVEVQWDGEVGAPYSQRFHLRGKEKS